MRFCADTFIRHAGNESLLWNRRTSACAILTDARPFLDAVDFTDQRVESIIGKIAGHFDTTSETVENDAREFLATLLTDTFCEDFTDTTASAAPAAVNKKTEENNTTEKDDSRTPLGDFFTVHHLASDLHVDLTSGCTERCIHCYIPDYTPHFFPLPLIKKVLTEFREANGLNVFFSGGECMMHPDFAEILRFAKKLNLNIVIQSNLTLCAGEKIDLMKEIDPQFVNVSLYSMDATVHDGITRHAGSWKKTMNAILALEQNGVHVRLACPVMKNNLNSVPDLKAFANAHRMHLILDCDIFGQTDHDCSNQSCALNAAELETALTRYQKFFYTTLPDASAFPPEAKVCDIGTAKININARGEYYPCDGCHGIVLGNAETDSFADVWNGEKLNALRALKNKDFHECAECENRRWCKVCPIRNFNETGDMFRHAKNRCVAATVKRKVMGE